MCLNCTYGNYGKCKECELNTCYDVLHYNEDKKNLDYVCDSCAKKHNCNKDNCDHCINKKNL